MTNYATNQTYRLLYNFLNKWHKNREYSVKTRQFLSMYYQGRLISDIKHPENRPSDMARAYAEIELGLDYLDYEDLSPMQKDFLYIVKYFQDRLQPHMRCTYHHVAGDNKRYESGSTAGILVNCVDEAIMYFME